MEVSVAKYIQDSIIDVLENGESLLRFDVSTVVSVIKYLPESYNPKIIPCVVVQRPVMFRNEMFGINQKKEEWQLDLYTYVPYRPTAEYEFDLGLERAGYVLAKVKDEIEKNSHISLNLMDLYFFTNDLEWKDDPTPTKIGNNVVGYQTTLNILITLERGSNTRDSI